jgi:response regulator NasT
LRCLIANESDRELQALATMIRALGHEVVAEELDFITVGPAALRLQPDIALVCPGEHIDHALGMIERIVREAVCPVVLVGIPATQPLHQASKLGVFGYVSNDDAAEAWRMSMDIARRRFDDYHNLEGAFVRRAVIEQAKGILMERHRVDDAAAYDLLREHARSTNGKLVDVAHAVIGGHRLLPGAG